MAKMAARMLTLCELHIATQTKIDCRGWLRRNRLLPVNMTCPWCNSVMEECQYSRVSDGVIWRCPAKQCRVTVSVWKGSLFENPLPLTKLCELLRWWRHSSRHCRHSIWVFGGVELGMDQFFMVLVPRRDANTLVPLIQCHIHTGTRIRSDDWAAYARLNQVGYIHKTSTIPSTTWIW